MEDDLNNLSSIKHLDMLKEGCIQNISILGVLTHLVGRVGGWMDKSENKASLAYRAEDGKNEYFDIKMLVCLYLSSISISIMEDFKIKLISFSLTFFYFRF